MADCAVKHTFSKSASSIIINNIWTNNNERQLIQHNSLSHHSFAFQFRPHSISDDAHQRSISHLRVHITKCNLTYRKLNGLYRSWWASWQHQWSWSRNSFIIVAVSDSDCLYGPLRFFVALHLAEQICCDAQTALLHEQDARSQSLILCSSRSSCVSVEALPCCLFVPFVIGELVAPFGEWHTQPLIMNAN